MRLTIHIIKVKEKADYNLVDIRVIVIIAITIAGFYSLVNFDY